MPPFYGLKLAKLTLPFSLSCVIYYETSCHVTQDENNRGKDKKERKNEQWMGENFLLFTSLSCHFSSFGVFLTRSGQRRKKIHCINCRAMFQIRGFTTLYKQKSLRLRSLFSLPFFCMLHNRGVSQIFRIKFWRHRETPLLMAAIVRIEAFLSLFLMTIHLNIYARMYR